MCFAPQPHLYGAASALMATPHSRSKIGIRRAAGSLLMCILVVVYVMCQPDAAVAALINPRGVTSPGASGAAALQAPAVCRVTIKGAAEGGISSASMKCTGGPIAIIIHDELLGKFVDSFQGVTVERQSLVPCLLSLTRPANIEFVDSLVQGVHGNGTSPRCILLVADGRVQLNHSHIATNMAIGLIAMHTADVTLTGSNIEGNVGQLGGLVVAGTARARILDGSRITRNTAINGSGGGIRVGENGRLILSNSILESNWAANNSGGGLSVSGNGSAHILGGTCIASNSARDYAGGGVHARDNATVLIEGASQIVHNTVLGSSGGGIAAFDNAHVLIRGASIVESNLAANGSGGGLSLSDNASAHITEQSLIASNVAQHYAGGGIQARGKSSLLIDGASRVVSNNATADSGGGIAVFGHATVLIAGATVVANNYAQRRGGGVFATENSTVYITEASRILRNQACATRPGGGVAAASNASVTLSGGSTVANNSAEQGGGGLAIVGVGVLCCITNHTLIEGNDAKDGAGGGLFINEGNNTVNITNHVRFHNNAAGNSMFGQLLVAKDIVMPQDAHDVFMDTSVYGDEGQLTLCSQTVTLLGLGTCPDGFYRDMARCRCCPASTYSFEPNTSSSLCRPCPAFATCPGGTQVLPMTGYWSSSRSIQMHQCPLVTACGKAGACEPGYQGNLCASCAQGFGMTLPFRCGGCMSPGRQLGLYILFSCVTAVFIALTVYFTWRDSCQGDSHMRTSDLIKVVVQFLQYMVILGSVSAPWPPMLKTLFTASSIVFGAASGQALSLDCWLMHYVHLPALPLAVQRQLVNFVAPAALACSVMILFIAGRTICLVARWAAGLTRCRCLSPSSSRRTRMRSKVPILVRQVPVIIIVVVYYSYPTLVRAALGWFACVHIDDASIEPYAEYAICNHTAGYWMFDMYQECYVGWHRGWAFGLGLPAVMVLCIGMPAGLCYTLLYKRARTADPAFRECFGFLYRNHNDKYVWWEAIWTAQCCCCVSLHHQGLLLHNSAEHHVFGQCSAAGDM